MLGTTSQTLLLLVALGAALLLSDAAAENATQSGCQICASTGDCSRAYQGGAGQYCGNWLDRSNTRQSCCCPTNAVCKLSNYACNCAWAGGGRQGGGGAYDPGYGYDRGGAGYAFEWLWWLLGSLLLLLCCSSFFFMLCKKRTANESHVAYATPEPVPPTYGSAPSAPVYTAQPVYGNTPGYAGGGGGGVQPMYSSAPGYSGMGNRGGMSAGAGAALGGGAGLLGGLLLGEAIADAGRPSYGGYDGYDGADGGGGDFGGDF